MYSGEVLAINFFYTVRQLSFGLGVLSVDGMLKEQLHQSWLNILFVLKQRLCCNVNNAAGVFNTPVTAQTLVGMYAIYV